MAVPTNNMRSLDRAFDVLGVLQDAKQPLRLSEVARHASLHVATVQRILGVLLDGPTFDRTYHCARTVSGWRSRCTVNPRHRRS